MASTNLKSRGGGYQPEMDDAERAYNALDVVPEEYPRTRRTKVAQPVLARNAFTSFAQGLPDALQKNAKLTVVFDEFHHVNHDVTRTGVGHNPLDLSHLVQPKLSEVFVDRLSGLSPEFQA